MNNFENFNIYQQKQIKKINLTIYLGIQLHCKFNNNSTKKQKKHFNKINLSPQQIFPKGIIFSRIIFQFQELMQTP